MGTEAREIAVPLREGRQGPTELYEDVVSWLEDPKRKAGDGMVYCEHGDREESRLAQRALYAALRHHVRMADPSLRWATRRAKRGKLFEVHVLVVTKLPDDFLQSGGDPRPGKRL